MGKKKKKDRQRIAHIEKIKKRGDRRW